MKKTTELPDKKEGFGKAANLGDNTTPDLSKLLSDDLLSDKLNKRKTKYNRSGPIEERDPNGRSSISLYLSNKNLMAIKAEIKDRLIKEGKAEEDIGDKDYRGLISTLVDQILSARYKNR